MEGADIVESPRKRLKTDNNSVTDDAALPSSNEAIAQSDAAKLSAEEARELEVGITEFVSGDNEGFYGILKKRYNYSLNTVIMQALTDLFY